MSSQALLDSWSSLPTPTSAEWLESSETAPDSLAWLARDSTDRCHLLLQVPDSAEVPEAATKGLGVSVTRHRIPELGETNCIDLACLDDATLKVFAAVAAEMLADLVGVPLEGRSGVVAGTLARWRWFWDVELDGLSERDALGLFGELWFLDQWVGVTPQNVTAWGGSDSARHDFQWPEFSVEVKTTGRRGTGAIVHTVQHLEQLADPEMGTLYLFSLRVTRDRLASNTLATLVSRCSDQLSDAPDIRDSFLRMVSMRGYSPADGSLGAVAYRIIDERIYEVGEGFPRLTPDSFPDGLPAAIVDVSYRIDMSACEPWRRDRDLLEFFASRP